MYGTYVVRCTNVGIGDDAVAVFVCIGNQQGVFKIAWFVCNNAEASGADCTFKRVFCIAGGKRSDLPVHEDRVRCQPARIRGEIADRVVRKCFKFFRKWKPGDFKKTLQCELAFLFIGCNCGFFFRLLAGCFLLFGFRTAVLCFFSE